MIVFLHIPKTAGSTFQFILENTFGPAACHTDHNKSRVFGPEDLRFARKIFPRLRSIAGHNLVDPLQLIEPGMFYLTFLREPVARVFSHYQNMVNHGKQRATFEETLRTTDILQNLQVKLLAGRDDLGRAKQVLEQFSFVGLTERFDLSLRVLERLSPCRLNLHYIRRRIARSNSVRRELEQDARIVDLVREFNRNSIELYRFATEELFPKFCQRAGVAMDESLPTYERYRSEVRLRYVLSHAYNMIVYRQACKWRKRRAR
jgi:hypothetical protein